MQTVSRPPRLSLKVPRSDIRLPLWHWLPLVAVGGAIAVLPLELAILAVGGLIGLGVLALIISQPLFGLALALFAGPLWAVEAEFIGGIIGTLSSGQLVLFLTLACWLGRSLKDGRITIPHTSLNGPIFLFLVIAGFAVFQAESTFDGVKELIKWVEVLLIIWMVLDLTREFRPKTVILGLSSVLILAGLAQAALGIWQFALAGTGPGHFIISGTLYRATGTFQQPNPFGGFMSMTLSIAVGLLIGLLATQLEKRDWNLRQITHAIRSNWAIPITILAAILLFIGLIGSWSRGAWLNFVGSMTLLAFFLPRSRKRGLSLAIGGLISFFLAWSLGLVPATIRNRLTGFASDFELRSVRGVGINADNYSVLERLAHWEAAIEMWRERLWTGIGFGNYETVYDDYRLPQWEDALGHAHNYYLNILAEAGIFGLIGYLFLWFSVFRITLYVVRKGSWFNRGLGLGLLAVWTGISIHHLLDNLYVNNLFIHYAVMFSLLIVLQSSVKLNGEK